MVLAVTVLALPAMHLVMLPALALPATSLLLLLAGFTVAACAHCTGHGAGAEAERVGPKDVAGALVLLGFAAALLSDAETALASIEHWQIGLIASGPM